MTGEPVLPGLFKLEFFLFANVLPAWLAAAAAWLPQCWLRLLITQYAATTCGLIRRLHQLPLQTNLFCSMLHFEVRTEAF